ncbi:MAG: alternative ribosome rescue aminoacyl-tRNA hydrolase ArfB [Thiohalorhabdus sp.]
MLRISNQIRIPEDEIEIQAVRAQGPGGQHADKGSTAVHLRFDVRASSLPEHYRERLLAMGDSRITREGVVVIKAQAHRSRERNRQEALDRLRSLIQSAGQTPRKRRPTRPSRASQRRRMEAKKRHKQKKALRKKVL